MIEIPDSTIIIAGNQDADKEIEVWINPDRTSGVAGMAERCTGKTVPRGEE
jgi:hypothetical protein